jgi:hypothetical protein
LTQPLELDTAEGEAGRANLAQDYFCRVGRHGTIGRYRAVRRLKISRGDQLIVRTNRGVELAMCLRMADQLEASLEGPAAFTEQARDGKIIRVCSSEDRLLIQKLSEAAMEAFETCQDWLIKHALSDVLLEVEPLLDGRTIYFHFLGIPSEALKSHLESLASIFEATAKSSSFAKLLDEGCGPGCGSDGARGCGSEGGCSVCVVAKACGK